MDLSAKLVAFIILRGFKRGFKAIGPENLFSCIDLKGFNHLFLLLIVKDSC